MSKLCSKLIFALVQNSVPPCVYSVNRIIPFKIIDECSRIAMQNRRAVNINKPFLFREAEKKPSSSLNGRAIKRGGGKGPGH